MLDYKFNNNNIRHSKMLPAHLRRPLCQLRIKETDGGGIYLSLALAVGHAPARPQKITHIGRTQRRTGLPTAVRAVNHASRDDSELGNLVHDSPPHGPTVALVSEFPCIIWYKNQTYTAHMHGCFMQHRLPGQRTSQPLTMTSCMQMENQRLRSSHSPCTRSAVLLHQHLICTRRASVKLEISSWTANTHRPLRR